MRPLAGTELHAGDVLLTDLLAPTIEARFRSEFDLAVIGLKRGRAPHCASPLHEPLKLGDLLLLVGSWKAIRRLQSDWKDLIVLELPAELDDVVPAASRAPMLCSRWHSSSCS